MSKHIIPYSLTISVAVISVMLALGLGWISLLLGIVYFFLSRYCLGLMTGKTKESDPYKKVAEQIAMLGMMIFLPLIFTLGITSAILIFVVFAQIALNLQTFEKRQFYLGITLSFTLITFSASESREGGFLFLFIPYSLFLCATLFGLQVEKLNLTMKAWLKSSGLLLLVSFAIYLVMPRLPALQLGAVPGSDHFYHKNTWLEASESSLDSGDQNQDSQDDFQSETEQLDDALHALKQKMEDLVNEQDQEGKGKGQDDLEYGNEIAADNLGLENSARLNPNIVMYVRSDYPLYLTTEIFDQFNGQSWAQSEFSEQYIKENNGNFIVGTKPALNENLLVSGYEIDIVEDMKINIPMAWQATGLQFPASALKKDTFGSFMTPDILKAGTSYRAEFKAQWHEGRLLYSTEEVDLAPFLTTYPNIDSRIQSLAVTVAKDGRTSLEKALLLEHHLRENFAYTLDTAIHSQGRTPLSEFLFDTQYGHCEYFASAMAIMLRTIGIPSRVVNGFSATDINPLTGFIEVRGTDAHAWTEAYIDGLGWMPFEPTSYYQLPDQKQNTELTYEQVNDYVDRQLEILEQQESAPSFKQLMLSAWQSLVAVISIAVLSIKWLIVEYGYALLALGILAILVYMLWQQIKPAWLKYRLKRKINHYELKGGLVDLEFYLAAISDSLQLSELNLDYSTVEDLLSELVHVGLVDEHDAHDFLLCFNQAAYSQKKPSNIGEQTTWIATIVDALMANKVIIE